ncbi:hypothetical protein [Streptomyces sp. NPDC057910]|uniref:hypothetical protein n=1 Tax=Streptomyces sp. NPDC057910 TaxID=3346278 RepID=UPI001DFE5F2F|nr:hypothetical protein [Streptomyces sp. MAG02]
MSGYTSRYIALPFPELGDRVSVLLRNPRLLPPSEITPRDVALGPDGQPVDSAAAQQAMYEVMARVIAAWNVYDASSPGAPIDIDLDAPDFAEQLKALEAADQTRLGPITADNVARLPMAIIAAISDELGRVADPS